MLLKKTVMATIAASFLVSAVFAAPSEHFKIFLCFGQSNIAGGAGVSPGADETKTTDRVLAFAFNDCGSPSWKKDTWVSAREPLHCGDGGAGNSTMGPVYVFGKAMADSLPGDTIGLIPCGQSGVNIETFMPGGRCSASYCVPYPGSNVYDFMLKKCQKAIERGVLAGIILHQGESNSGDGDAWLTKVKTIYDNLKKDIPLKNDIPLVAGQLLGSSALNTTIAKMSTAVPIGYYASSSGLSGGGTYPSLHFNQDGYREMGKRMSVEMMKGIRSATAVREPSRRVLSASAVSTLNSSAKIYSLDGRLVNGGSAAVNSSSFRAGNIYLVAGNGAASKLMIAPAAKQ